MWIDASIHKPDTARKVFIRGIEKGGTDRVVIAAWLDFDNRWSNFIIIDNEYYTPDLEDVAYWCEITDILKLPMAGEQAKDSKTAVHKGLIPLGCSVMEVLDWALEMTLEEIAYAESKIKWDAAQDKETDSDAIEWRERSMKRYQRLFAAWERRTNEML